jgi:peptide/nickel transport system permease protein
VTAAAEALPAGARAAGKSPVRLFWERFRQDRVAVAGGVVAILLVLIAIGGGPLAKSITGHAPNLPYDNAQNEFGNPIGPSSSFWFGADAEGRDLFVRTMYGTRTALEVGLAATALSVLIGLVIGLIAGYVGGFVDTILSRFADVMLALPQLVIGIGIAAACSTSKTGCLGGLLQPGIAVVIVVITFFSWSYIARLVRGYTLSLREKDFVEAARAVGSSNKRIIFFEILPNLVGPLVVYTTLLIPTNILFEAALTFLGLGVPVDVSSWGQALSEASSGGLYQTAWWIVVFPGMALVITTLAFNLLGDGLSDALDVRTDR